MWKRISAFLFDGIMFAVMAALFAMILSWAVGYDGYYGIMMDKYRNYGEKYGVDMRLSPAAYEELDQETRQRVDEAFRDLNGDDAAVRAYDMMRSLQVVIVTGGLLLSYLIYEFLIPLLLGHGRTVGKKLFGLGVMRTDGVKINHLVLFIRTFLGKFTIETMIPLFIGALTFMGSLGLLGTVLLLLIALIEIVLMLRTPTRSMIHDLMANTAVIDYASQMIFDSREAMIEYKEKIHAEKARNEAY